jgi:hypothetical protein
MYILTELPKTEAILPKGFKQGSRAELDATLKKVKSTFPQGIVDQWNEFEKDAPKNDDATDYVKSHPDSM